MNNSNKISLSEKAEKKMEYPRLYPLWLAIFVDILGFYVIIPLVPDIIKLFNTSALVGSLLIASNAVFTFIFAPLWGKWSDRYGRKPMLLLAQFGTLAGFLLFAFSNSLWMLFVSRIVDGVFGGNFPIAKAIISDVTPPKDRGLQMTNIGVAHVLASLIGPGLGGILFFFGGLLFPGLASSLLSIIMISITFFMLSETWPEEKRLSKHDMQNPTDDLKIINNKNALYMLFLWGFHTISFTLLVSNMPIFLGLILGLNSLAIGILLNISGVFRALMRFTLFKPTLRWLGEKKMILSGLAGFIAIFLFIGFADNLIVVTILLILMSFAASAVRGNLLSVISQTVSYKIQGRINSLSTSLDSVAQIIGPIVGGIIFDLSVLNILHPGLWGIIMAIIGSIALIMFALKFFPIRNKEKDN
jgi:MFS family permease